MPWVQPQNDRWNQMLQGFGKSCVLHGVFRFGAMFFCGIYTHDEGVCVDLVY